MILEMQLQVFLCYFYLKVLNRINEEIIEGEVWLRSSNILYFDLRWGGRSGCGVLTYHTLI